MVFSALTIQQSQGMIESHFGIFTLLAFLLYYRDWRPIVAAAGLMPQATADALSEAYVFLRRVEHRIQYLDDQQTHVLPMGCEPADGDQAGPETRQPKPHFARRSSSTLAWSFATCASASPNGVGGTTFSRVKPT
jgi:hypothetical protein